MSTSDQQCVGFFAELQTCLLCILTGLTNTGKEASWHHLHHPSGYKLSHPVSMSRPRLYEQCRALIFIWLSATDHRWCSTFFLSLSDASDLCSIKQCAQQVGSLVGTGGLNLLINNAGIMVSATLEQTTTEDMQNSFNTNVMGPMNIIRVRERITTNTEL